MNSELNKVEGNVNLSRFAEMFNQKQFQDLREEITFAEYIDRCLKNPRLVRSAYQMMYDMIISKGTKTKEIHRKSYTHIISSTIQKCLFTALKKLCTKLFNFSVVPPDGTALNADSYYYMVL